MNFRELSKARAFAFALFAPDPLRICLRNIANAKAYIFPTSGRQRNHIRACQGSASLFALDRKVKTTVTYAERYGAPPLQAVRNSDIC
jgi:hypothetical protein